MLRVRNDLPQPKLWRLILGFVATPLFIPLLSVWDAEAGVLLSAERFAFWAAVMYLPMVVAGLPVYFLLRRRIYFSWFVCCLLAGLIGLIFSFLLGAVLTMFYPQPSGGELLIQMAAFLIGLIHGHIFWMFVVFRDKSFSGNAPRAVSGYTDSQ